MKEFKVTRYRGHFKQFLDIFFEQDFSKRVEYKLTATFPGFVTTIYFFPRCEAGYKSISHEDHEAILSLLD